jgi:hypothetical protein
MSQSKVEEEGAEKALNDPINPSATLRDAERSARKRQVAGYQHLEAFNDEEPAFVCRACQRKSNGG